MVPRTLADEALLRRSDDLLVDFDRGFPIVAMGSSYWKGMLDFISERGPPPRARSAGSS